MYRRGRTGLALLVLAVLGVAQANDATVFYRDHAAKKTVDVKGVIEEENFLGIKLKAGRGKEAAVFIPAADIQRIYYKTKDADALSYRQPFNKEDSARTASDKRRVTLLNEALEGYTKLAKEVTTPAEARRYLQYKVAEVLVAQARDNKSVADKAIKALVDFKTNHRAGWELLLALESLARLHEEAGKLDEARKTYDELADLPDAPDAVKQKSGVLVGKLYLRGKQYKEAETRLAKIVEVMSATNADKPIAQAYLIESRIGQDKTTTAQKDLDGLIKGNADPRVRSLAYALLGDYYLKKGQQDDAFWNYLRVDAQYNDDADAQARALYQLSILFDKVRKDPLRGKECLTRLLDPRFKDSPYQKVAEGLVDKAKDKE